MPAAAVVQHMAIAAEFTSKHVTVTFRPQGQHMLSSCHTVYVYYQVWFW